MALAPGVRLGPYAITAQIGVGGMGRWCMNPLGQRSPETGIRADLLGGTEPPRTTLWG